MSLLNAVPLSALHFYLTAPYPCSYLPGFWACSQVATPNVLISSQVYSELAQHGFRRSGTYTYRPYCEGCQACVPLRVQAGQFTANRTQRRAWVQHANLQTSLHRIQDKPEYYDLYQRYQCVRHPEGDMDNHESYLNVLSQSHVDSLLVEFREPFDPADGTTGETTSHPTKQPQDSCQVVGYSHSTKPASGQVAGYQDRPFDPSIKPFNQAHDRQGALRMVSLIDLLGDGLSSVYTFYEPDLPHARFGVYNVLWQIELCRQLKLDFVYLGYWIKHSRKMAYKVAYQPAQGLINGAWQALDKPALS